MSNRPNITRSSRHDPAKNYVGVALQRGVPVVDYDFNEVGEISVEQSGRAAGITNRIGASPAHEWAFIPLSVSTSDASPGNTARNRDNFGITLGRILTKYGVLDTLPLTNSSSAKWVAFDYAKLEELSATAESDLVYANCLFRGTVTEGSTGGVVIDADKRFVGDHALTGRSSSVTVPGTSAAGIGSEISTTVPEIEVDVSEPPARVVMLTGANAGAVREILARSSETSVTVTTPFEDPIEVGDEYVIVPGNAIVSLREEFDAASAGDSAPFGGLSWLHTYLHVWLDDVSPNEDPDLVHPAIPSMDVTHRSAIRWCVRTCLMRLGPEVSPEASPIIPTLFHNEYLRSLMDFGVRPSTDDRDFHRRMAVSAGIGYDGEDVIDSADLRADLSSMYRTTGTMARALTPSGLGRGVFGRIFDFCDRVLRFGWAGSTTDTITLWLLSAPGKTDDEHTLSDIVFPNRPLVDGAEVIPLFRTRARVDDSDVGALPGNFIQRVPVLLDSTAVGEELVMARQVSIQVAQNQNSGGNSSVPVNSGSPVVFDSLPQHLSVLDSLVFSMAGLGGALGPVGETGEYEYLENCFLPHGVAVVEGGSALNAAGQSAGVFTTSLGHLLNPSENLLGTVYRPDVLAPSEQPEGFVGGTAGYELADGTSVAMSDLPLISDASELVGTTNRNPRAVDQGLLQAAAARDGVEFRKLAVKTHAGLSADLFTYDIRANWGIGDETELSGWIDAEGIGSSAIGAFLSGQNTQAGKSLESRESYTVGSVLGGAGSVSANSIEGGKLPYLAPSADTSSFSVYNAAVHPIEPGTRGSQAVDGSAVGAESAKIDTVNGPWGRFPIDSGDAESVAANMRDTWENRCTSAVLRYHIGDFYPAPDGSNALVDNINLFVRLEPLSLVHWATMPKHQHSTMAKSFSFYESVRQSLDFLTVSADLAHLIDEDGVPKKTATTPDVDEFEIGDSSMTAMPFAHKHQPFVHWYHPMMEQLTAPHLQGDYEGSEEQARPYMRWGERSLVAPGLAASTVPQAGPANENWARTDSLTAADVVGDHAILDIDLSGGFSGTVLRDGVTINTAVNQYTFPFIPRDPVVDLAPDTAGWHQAYGVPGPVFLPAFRMFAANDDFLGTAKEYVGYNPILSAKGVSGFGDDSTIDSGDNEWAYFPRVDGDATPAGIAAKWGMGSDVNPSSAYDWKFPVLRSAIRTDTVAAILNLFAGRLGVVPYDGTDVPKPEGSDEAALSGPDADTDSAWVGASGTSIAASSFAPYITSNYYLNPLLLGGKWSSVNGRQKGLADGDADSVSDVFELAALERETLAFGSDEAPELANADFLPLVNTLSAIRYLGLQQKLLWNSSIRVLHTRPGGGYKGLGGVVSRTSEAPKSLTELFIVRNRVTGAAVPLPHPPDAPHRKPFLHLESIHPAAAGGVTVNGVALSAHPNHAKLGHLYRMVQDSVGGYAAGTGGADNLWDADGVNHDLTAASWSNTAMNTGLTGDTYAADPFDYEFAQRTNPAKARVAKTDRLHENSGVEIDILGETRFVRENAEDHGLDLAAEALGDLTWLDMMPTAEELSEPGDHALIFVLYTGRYGQRMVDADVPPNRNPPFAGLHITASVEVNRPSAKRSTAGGGQWYGATKDTFHVLGHL